MIRWLLNLFRGERGKVLNIRFVSYSEADALIKADPRWRISRLEDRNRLIGWVFIEQVEPVKEPA